MRKFLFLCALTAIAACGQQVASNDAQAQPSAAAASATGDVTDAEKSAILAALSLNADGSGQVENECGEKVTPQYLPTDLGAGVGRAISFIMVGGPNTVSCYGDGPLVQLMRSNNGAFSEIYMNRGGPMIILSTTHANANDLADGGPGFSFPVWQWNGSEYVNANRTVADSALGDARFVPN